VSGGNYYSNCWGYTDPQGREYALMGAVTGLSIIDITNTDSLREVAFIGGVTSTWREIKTYSHYAYVVTDVVSSPDSLLGTAIVDLSELPDTARLVRRWVHTNGTRNTKLAHTISIHDGYLYLNGCSNWSPQSVLIFSLNDPVNPTYVGSWGTEYIHDSMVRNDTMFAADIYTPGGLYIVDVRDKANPQTITEITYTGAGTHNAWTTADGRYVLTTDEIGSTPKTLKVWDIRSLPSWSAVTSFTPDPSATVHNVHIKGDYAYVAWYTAGVHVVDISDPTQPVHAGGMDTFLPTPTSPYQGCWGVFPYYNSNKFIASDRQTGLYVFALDSVVTGVHRLNNPALPSSLTLHQNYPNPFNPGTVIRYSVPLAGHVTLTILNVLGEEVATLADEVHTAGEYEVRFDGTSLPSGVYICRLAGGRMAESRKMLLLK
jgi:choice-of-anchor B domain-containing protein